MASRTCPKCSLEIDDEQWEHLVCPRCLIQDAVTGETESLRETDLSTRTVVAPLAEPARRARHPLEGRKISRYHVRRVIASGGMGTVFEATQDKPRRTVAVKVMRRGIASPAALRRFEYEAQLLGGLRHPGIAQIFEAGTHEDGDDMVPYFVMEYIPGARSLTQFAHESRLGIRQRLELFAGICDAVHHGHQKGVIHRDLKPGNILVDSAGFAKVIDFGVARSTDSDVALTTMHTDVGQLVGTLQYMSPEQALADPAELDIRSDVYSLGVVLYELLCGQPPYDVSQVPLLQATRSIRESVPTRPSTMVPALRGDVETIALKALEKDREQRYQSAYEFAADIRRYLRGEPILAHPPSVPYQVRVFVRRNKGLVASLAAVFAILLGATIVSATLYVRAEAARSEAARERDSAEAVTEYLRSTLASADPSEARGRDVTVREVLDRSAAQIGSSFGAQPTVEAAVRDTLGNTYMALGAFDQAEPQLDASLDLRRAQVGAEAAPTLSTLSSLARLRWYQGRFDESERLVRQVLEARRRVLGPEHRDTLASMGFLGQVLRDAGKNAEAERMFSDLLEIQRRVLGPEAPITLSAQYTLATLIEKRGGFAEAERLHRATLESRLRVFGEDHRDTLWSMTLLAYTLIHAERPLEAEPILHRALPIQKRVLGESHFDTLWTENVRGLMLDKMGRLDEAEAQFQDVLRKRTDLLGEEHRDTLWTTTNLALTLCHKGRYAEAEPLARRALGVRERQLGAHHWDTAWSRVVLAEILFNRGDLKESERLLRQAVADLDEIAWRHTTSLQLLGENLVRQGRVQEAEEVFRDVHARISGKPDAPEPFVQRNLRSLQELGGAKGSGDALRDAGASGFSPRSLPEPPASTRSR